MPYLKHWKKRPWQITARKREILRLLALGKSNKEIGRELGCSHLSVKNNLRVIFEIYDVRNRVAAVLTAMARGDVEAQDVLREFA